jgi:hypothetical protein
MSDMVAVDGYRINVEQDEDEVMITFVCRDAEAAHVMFDHIRASLEAGHLAFEMRGRVLEN